MTKWLTLLTFLLPTLPLEANLLRQAVRSASRPALFKEFPARTMATITPTNPGESLGKFPPEKLALAVAVTGHPHPFSLLLDEKDHGFEVSWKLASGGESAPIAVNHLLETGHLTQDWVIAGSHYAARKLALAETEKQLISAVRRGRFWEAVDAAHRIEVHEGLCLLGSTAHNTPKIDDPSMCSLSYPDRKAFFGQLCDRGQVALGVIRLFAAYSAGKKPNAYMLQLLSGKSMPVAWASKDPGTEEWSGQFEAQAENNPFPFPEDATP